MLHTHSFSFQNTNQVLPLVGLSFFNNKQQVTATQYNTAAHQKHRQRGKSWQPLCVKITNCTNYVKAEGLNTKKVTEAEIQVLSQ